jgi:hypothetical protein
MNGHLLDRAAFVYFNRGRLGMAGAPADFGRRLARLYQATLPRGRTALAASSYSARPL